MEELSAFEEKSLYSVDNGSLRLHLHTGQARAWLSKSRHTLVLAGTQGGKTSFGPWWLYREIYGMGDLPGYTGMKGRGGGDYLAVTSSFDLFKLKMLPEIRTVFEDVLKVGRYWAGDRLIELKDPRSGQYADNGSGHKMWGRIILRSANAPSGLESSTAKGAWLDEVGQDEWDISSWEAILRRLSLARGRSLGTTTVYNMGFVKTEIYDRWMAGDPNYNVIQFSSIENPAFPKEEFEDARKRLPKWRFKMFYKGQFSTPAGLIYGEYKESVNLSDLDISDIPLSWKRVIGVDFGGANNAEIFLVEDPNTKIWHAYLEVLEGGISSKEHVNNTLKKLKGAKSFRAVGGALSEIQSRKDWTDSGMKVEAPPFGDLEVGISNVIELFKTQRLKIHPSLGGVRHELATYKRKMSPDGKTVLNEILNKETFHRLDSLRYACSIITHSRSLKISAKATQGNYINSGVKES